MNQTREQHIQWCKDRALEILKSGDINRAYASMVSDLGEHPETKDHSSNMLGIILMMSGRLSTQDAMKKFIEGYY